MCWDPHSLAFCLLFTTLISCTALRFDKYTCDLLIAPPNECSCIENSIGIMPAIISKSLALFKSAQTYLKKYGQFLKSIIHLMGRALKLWLSFYKNYRIYSTYSWLNSSSCQRFFDFALHLGIKIPVVIVGDVNWHTSWIRVEVGVI